MLDDQRFLQLINDAPLVAIDLVIRNAKGAALLGRRRNRPARGYWFVPGGRIRKGESLGAAFARIAHDELRVALKFETARLIGVYDHFYADNVFDAADVSTHYVAIGFGVELPVDVAIDLDAQHAESRWWSVAALLDSDRVHANTKAYFDC